MKKICLIATGGTIAMVRNGSGILEPFLNGKDILSLIPELKELADIDVIQLCNMDSSDMQPENWIEIARTIYKKINLYDGFVVLHGTDTMVYTAAALSFIIQNLNKPIVITGSQKPLNDIATDARNNLINSVNVACSNISEVCIVFWQEIIRGVRAKKYSEYNLDAFHSVNQEPLGNIGLDIELSKEAKIVKTAFPKLLERLSKRCFLLKIWPGMEPKIIDTMVNLGYKGIVIEAFGAGNVPIIERSLIPQIKNAVKKGVNIVICTQCIEGCVDLSLYQGGAAALKAGAISALDMTPETALIKLMWVLGQTNNPEIVKRMMQTSYVGEISEI